MWWIVGGVALLLIVGFGAYLSLFLRKPVLQGVPSGYTRPRKVIPEDEREVSIRYVDRTGRLTKRPIVMDWVEDAGGGAYMLHAYCRYRMGERSFWLDGILRVECADGTVFDDPARFFEEKLGARIREFAARERS